jgi:UDP-N-acetylmuramoylalanine--D-glutamate ligase
MKKELYEEYFKGKKVTVLGLGLLGRGVGDTAFLAERGAELIVTDKKTEVELAPSLLQLEKYTGLKYVLGEHRPEDFEKRDYILKAAGVPYDSEYIEHAKKQKVPVYMSAALLCDIILKQLDGITIIGVTGTRGKSTVTQLIAHILRSSGMNVHLGGNVRGVANLPLLDVIEEGDFLVLELDSWQLQGFSDMKISPNIAVFTSFMDDHMNYYKNDREMYFNDKANIYRNQNEYDVLITSPQAAKEIVLRDKKVAPIVPDDIHFEMKLIGEHNQVAARLACEVARECGLPDDEIYEAIRTFSAVEGRLEDMGIFGEKKVRVFNDNNATTPEATIAALRAITETYGKQSILIIGGADKGLPLEALTDEIHKSTKSCIFLEGTGTSQVTLIKEFLFDTLKSCIDEAFHQADENDIILFSPAFASFGKEFNNEYEKNDAFVKAVEKYR